MFWASFILLSFGSAAAQVSTNDVSPDFSMATVQNTELSNASGPQDTELSSALFEGVLTLMVFGVFFLVASRRKVTTRKAALVAKQAEPVGTRNAYKAGAGLPSQGAASKSLGKVSEADIIARAVRRGKAADLPNLLDAAMARSLAANKLRGSPMTEEDIATSLLYSSLRACAAVRCFSEATAAYEHLAGRIGGGNCGLWSVLLYSLVEAECFGRCRHVFENLCKQGNPTGHDFVNMVRCYARQQDSDELRDMLANMRCSGQSVDTYTLNRSLASCGNTEHSLKLAEELAVAGICPEGLDAVGYNTLMKYNSRAGQLARCFELREQMAAKGLEASEVTFGILLDVCVGAKELDHARKVFDELCASGLRLNVVHCTTFIKGLTGAGKIQEAAAVLQEMVRSSGVKPDLIAYSTVVKAYAESGDVESSLTMVEQMIAENIQPDEIVYNGVLSACSIFPLKSAHVLCTFEKLLSIGMRPTTTTLSILLKALAHTEAWRASLQVLKGAPGKLHLQPELRLYSQLGQSCAKARSFEMVLEVFNAMVDSARLRHVPVDAVTVSRFIRSCLPGGAADAAQDVIEAARRAGITVETSLEKMVKTAMARKARSEKFRC